MTRTAENVDVLTREAAIARLRSELARLAGDDSVCRAAADRGLFCKGFCRFSEQELRERYSWIVRRRPNVTREELEKIANDWQLAQQEVHDLATSCDVQTKVHDTCRGWHDFTNEELAAFCGEITGGPLRVISS